MDISEDRDAIESWGERAAIREICGGLPVNQAEYLAVKDVEKWAGKMLPAVRAEALRVKETRKRRVG